MDRTSKIAWRGQVAILFIALAVLAATCIGCPPPPSIQSQAAKRAYAADQVVLRLGELQTAAIDANAHGLLSMPATQRVVRFTVDSAKVLRATPEGWQATVQPSYIALRNQLSAEEKARLGPYLSALDLILSAGGTP